jgi:hypothetical protein
MRGPAYEGNDVLCVGRDRNGAWKNLRDARRFAVDSACVEVVAIKPFEISRAS